MGESGIAYRLLDGNGAGERERDLLDLAGEVYGNAGDPAAERRARVWRRQPGFVLAEARHGGYLVGYASGMPPRPYEETGTAGPALGLLAWIDWSLGP